MHPMRTRRRAAVGAAVCAVVASLAAGCSSGSASKATPITNSPAATAPSGSAVRTATTVARSAGKASSAQLAALDQQLNDAGASLNDTANAISGADVNQAKAQEGSLP